MGQLGPKQVMRNTDYIQSKETSKKFAPQLVMIIHWLWLKSYTARFILPKGFRDFCLGNLSSIAPKAPFTLENDSNLVLMPNCTNSLVKIDNKVDS